ncbi:MAG: YicC family protein [Marinovum sp.]|nr:YicC family protein [Marinovum sp.]
MTGFSASDGAFGAFSWRWELRAVNGRGLDLRLRVPDWVEGLEMGLRKRLSDALTRGSVTLNLRLSRVSNSGEAALHMDALTRVLDALAEIEDVAQSRGHALAPATAADVLAVRGVFEAHEGHADTEMVAALRSALLKDFEAVLAAFLESRRTEGAAMKAVLEGHLSDIAALTSAADAALQARSDANAAQFRQALERVIQGTAEVPEDRIAQELAVLAVKADVTEEIDRLRTHISAGQTLLTDGGAIGRRFDFLMQEFNREANTLCSKSGDAALTSIGLDLKTKIDQLREQVQNVE